MSTSTTRGVRVSPSRARARRRTFLLTDRFVYAKLSDMNTDLKTTLKIQLPPDDYSITGLDWDQLIKIASESPTFRSTLQALTRSLGQFHSKHVDIIGLQGHLARMDARESDPEQSEPGVSELIEMLKLQTKVNESYARLAILLGEMYVEKAQR